MIDQNPDSGPRGCIAGEQHWQMVLEDGTELRGFRRNGEKTRMGIFLHGFRSHCDGEKSRHLSETAGLNGYDWLRFDQRGCGASSGELRRFTISGAIEDTHRVLEALGDPQCILVGSSLGALIALHIAADGGHRIEGLVLIAPALRFTERYLRQVSERELERWRLRGYRWCPDLYAGGCFRLDYDFCADALRYDDPPDRLACPIRAIHGTRDELLPLRDTRDWLARLDCPGVALEIVDGGDHRLTEWSDVIARQTEILLNETNTPCA